MMVSKKTLIENLKLGWMAACVEEVDETIRFAMCTLNEDPTYNTEECAAVRQYLSSLGWSTVELTIVHDCIHGVVSAS